jgi:hypothetical protein
MTQMGELPDAETFVIESRQNIEDRLPSLTAEFDADPPLALATGANPLNAARELGVEVAPEERFAVESRLRFAREETRAQLERLFAAPGPGGNSPCPLHLVQQGRLA